MSAERVDESLVTIIFGDQSKGETFIWPRVPIKILKSSSKLSRSKDGDTVEILDITNIQGQCLKIWYTTINGTEIKRPDMPLKSDNLEEVFNGNNLIITAIKKLAENNTKYVSEVKKVLDKNQTVEEESSKGRIKTLMTGLLSAFLRLDDMESLHCLCAYIALQLSDDPIESLSDSLGIDPEDLKNADAVNDPETCKVNMSLE